MDGVSMLPHQQQQPSDAAPPDSIRLNQPSMNHVDSQLEAAPESLAASALNPGVTSPDELPQKMSGIQLNGQQSGTDQSSHQNGSPHGTQQQAVKKSAIPRFVPSSIPRLHTQLSAPPTNKPQNSTPTSPESESQSKPHTPSLLVDPYSANGRSRVITRPTVSGFVRSNRSTSENPQKYIEADSDTSSVLSGTSSGAPRRITSKINSLKNAHHKPGGGNVAIVDQKIKLGPITSKCNSLANVKHKPGGGNVQIVDSKLDTSSVQSKVNSMQNVKHTPAGGQVQIVNEKLNFSERATSKVSSLSNVNHRPGGGNVQIVSEKLEYDKKAQSKVGSLKNAHHHPGGGDVKIFNENLPWLKYNKPNLPPEEKARINKRHGDLSSSVHSSNTALTSNSGGTR